IAAQERWPENPWLSMAAGATHAEHGNYLRAQPMFEMARNRLPAMREHWSIDAARLRRLNAADGRSELADLAANSEHLAMFLTIEKGSGLDGTALEPYASLPPRGLDVAS